MHKLEIIDLSVNIDNKNILKKFNLKINSGEIHALLGPNGIGKSTLSKVIMGDENYKIISGKIKYDDKDITNLSVDERACLGIFLGMQMPIEIEGVTNADLLRTSLHIKEDKNFKLMDFIKEVNNNCDDLKMDRNMIHRSVNLGFSGGERKKNEILQMNILKPNMILLDEIDSGLDIDSLKIVSNSIKNYYKKNNPGILLVTHYQRLLDYLKPTHVHIMCDGKIVKSGNIELIKEIESKGYEKILSEIGE